MVFSMTSQDSQDFLTQRINRTCTRPCIHVLNISCHSISNPHFCFNYAYEIPGVSVNPHGISVAPRQVWWVCLTSTGWSWDTRIRLRTCLDFIWGFYQRWQKRMTEVCNSYGISWITWVSVGWIDSILMYIDVRCSRFSLQTNVDRRSQEKLVFLIGQIEEVSQSSFSAWSSVMVNVRQCGSTLDVPRFFFVERLGNVQIYVIFIWLWSKKTWIMILTSPNHERKSSCMCCICVSTRTRLTGWDTEALVLRAVSGGAKNALGRFLTPAAQVWSVWTGRVELPGRRESREAT